MRICEEPIFIACCLVRGRYGGFAFNGNLADCLRIFVKGVLMFWLLCLQYIAVLLFGKIIIEQFTLYIWDLLYIIVCSILGLLLKRPNVIFLIACVVMTSLTLLADSHQIKQAVVAAIESILILIVIEHIANIIVRLLHISDFYMYLFIALEICSGTILFFIYNRQSEAALKNSIGIRELILSILTLVIVYGYVLFIEQNTTDFYDVICDLVFFAFFGITNVLLQFEHQRGVNRAVELKHQSALLDNHRRYIAEMEKHYTEMRKFRHDYQNVILALNEYLKTNDVEGLNDYYQNVLKPTSVALSEQKYELEDISHIEDKAIKGLLFSKLSVAQNEGIIVSFECPTVFECFCMKRIDLIIALGIIIDNAIEATHKSENGSIRVALFRADKEQIIIVENTIDEKLPPLWQLKKTGCSTKGNNRGLGLTNLQEIIDKYPRVYLETTYTDTVFVQKIIIGKDQLND